MLPCRSWKVSVFFFNDTPTTEIYALSLHDALPILGDSPLIDGAGTEAVTVKVTVLEVCPSGLTTATFQVPASLPLLNIGMTYPRTLDTTPPPTQTFPCRS